MKSKKRGNRIPQHVLRQMHDSDRKLAFPVGVTAADVCLLLGIEGQEDRPEGIPADIGECPEGIPVSRLDCGARIPLFHPTAEASYNIDDYSTVLVPATAFGGTMRRKLGDSDNPQFDDGQIYGVGVLHGNSAW